MLCCTTGILPWLAWSNQIHITRHAKLVLVRFELCDLPRIIDYSFRLTWTGTPDNMQQAGRYCTVSSDTSSGLLASRTDDLSQAPGASTPKPRPLYSVESLDYPFIPRLARFVKLGFLVSIIFFFMFRLSVSISRALPPSACLSYLGRGLRNLISSEIRVYRLRGHRIGLGCACFMLYALISWSGSSCIPGWRLSVCESLVPNRVHRIWQTPPGEGSMCDLSG